MAEPKNTEWRIHFHIPLHSPATAWYESTSDHVTGVLDLLKKNPSLCSHLEMETYTWEVLPAALKNRSVVDQLVAEYEWTLKTVDGAGIGRVRTIAAMENTYKPVAKHCANADAHGLI